MRQEEVSSIWGVIVCALLIAAPSEAAQPALKLTLARTIELRMTEIRFVDLQADQPASEIRILISGARVRQDFGRDDQGFILYDHPARTVWHVSPHDRRLTGVEAGQPGTIWPEGWKIGKEAMPSEQGVLTQYRVNDTLCLEYKSASLLPREAVLLAAYRRALAANYAKVWIETPDALNPPCSLAIDVELAGVEFSQGIPLAVRYWDGRSRVFQGYDMQPLRGELFELPAGFQRTMIRPGFQENMTKRQPAASHRR